MINYEPMSDLALQQLACQNDREAEEALISRYLILVRACARPLFLAGGDSEDLTQEGTFGPISAVRTFDPALGVPFKAYAELCIRKRLLSAVRSASRLKHQPLNDSVPIEQLSDDPSTQLSAAHELFRRSPEELVLARESKEEILAVLTNCLSTMESRVLDYYLEGLSYREIAQRVHKDEKAVDNAVQRFRRKLARNPILGDISED